MGTPEPKIPSPFLADVGKGRVYRVRRPAILERHDGDRWTVIGRYGSIREADAALDRELAGVADAGTLRVTPQPRGPGRVVLAVLLAVAAVAWLVILYLLLIR